MSSPPIRSFATLRATWSSATDWTLIDAWHEGRQAAQAGRCVRDNPYYAPEITHAELAWVLGFLNLPIPPDLYH